MKNIKNTIDSINKKCDDVLHHISKSPNVLSFDDMYKQYEKVNKDILYNTQINRYRIDIKGYIGLEVVQDHLLGANFTDSKFGYDSKEFVGTEKEYTEFLDYLHSKGHAEFKVIGSQKIEENVR